jgi:hypothetical protein
MNFKRENATGIDISIESTQTRLYDKLGYDKVDGYGRVYVQEFKERISPLWCLANGEYKEVLTNDQTNGFFFFVDDQRSKIDHPLAFTKIDIVFGLNLSLIKPTINGRADEQVRTDILNALRRCTEFRLQEVVKGIDVLSDFDHDLKDMQPYHYLKFIGEIKHKYNC